MSYLTKNGPNNRNSNFDLQRMEEERKKKELERHNEEEKRRKGEQTKKDSTILQSRITNKKRILESTKVEIKRLEREADEIDPKIRHLKEEIERFKNVSESNSLKTNAEKRRLSEIKIRIDEKKKEEEKVKKAISDLQKDYNFIEKDIKDKEYMRSNNGNLTSKEKEEIRKENEKSQLSAKIAILKQEVRQAEQVIVELERQVRQG